MTKRSSQELREVAKKTLSPAATVQAIEHQLDRLNGDSSDRAWEDREILLHQKAFLNGIDNPHW